MKFKESINLILNGEKVQIANIVNGTPCWKDMSDSIMKQLSVSEAIKSEYRIKKEDKKYRVLYKSIGYHFPFIHITKHKFSSKEEFLEEFVDEEVEFHAFLVEDEK
jgi:hypothetical protein